jgi:WD40 repeat protein
MGDIFAQANLVISWLGISKDIATFLTKAKTSGASESPLQSGVVRFYEAFRNSPYWQRASASEVSTVKIWGASSGACLQTLEGHSLCVSSAHLVSILASLHSNKIVTEPQQPFSLEVAIGLNDTCISYNAQDMLWLPTEYPPACSAMSGRRVGIGTRSGKVWFCRFPWYLQS